MLYSTQQRINLIIPNNSLTEIHFLRSFKIIKFKKSKKKIKP